MSFPGSGGLMGFVIVFTNVFLMLIYLLCGFSLVKSGKAESGHAKSVSGLLIYVCGPCMILNVFQSMEHSAENFGKMAVFFLVTLLLQLIFVGILYAVLHRRYDNPQYRILTAGAVLANGGFFGLPVITALFPNEPIVACYSTLYITEMNLLVFTVGVFLITRDKNIYIPSGSASEPDHSRRHCLPSAGTVRYPASGNCRKCGLASRKNDDAALHGCSWDAFSVGKPQKDLYTSLCLCRQFTQTHCFSHFLLPLRLLSSLL